MSLKKLSPTEKEIILSCISAIATGPFIKDDWELQTRLGVNRATLYQLIEAWPKIDDSAYDSDESLAINGAMNEVCHGLAFSDADWRKWFPVERNAVRAVFEKWRRDIYRNE